jgi:hypothetical protein
MPLQIHIQPDPDHLCETCGGPSELTSHSITRWLGNKMAREVSPPTPRCVDPSCQSRRLRHLRRETCPSGCGVVAARRPVRAENERRHWHSPRSTRSLTILGSDTHQTSPTVRNVIPDVGDRLSFAVRTNHLAEVRKSLSRTPLAECTYSERALFLRGEGLVDSAAGYDVVVGIASAAREPRIAASTHHSR